MKAINFQIPASWNTLSDTQLCKIASLFFSKQNQATLDYKLFKAFANYKWYKIKLLKKIAVLFKNYPASSIRNHFSFIYQKQDLTRFVKIVKIGNTKYYAPADRLTNLSIGEFSVTEDLYLGYLRNAKNSKTNFGEIYLRYLFAVLYVADKSVKRPLFNKEYLEQKVKETEKVPYKFLLTTLLSYKGCRDAIATSKKYKHIFPDKKTDPNIEIKIPKNSGFSDVILSFSGKIFGDYHSTFKTNIYTFLDGYEMALTHLEKSEK